MPHPHSTFVRLALAALTATPFANAQLALQHASGFVRFDEHLRDPGVIVVVGELERIVQGKRERADAEDADLGQGGVVAKVAGTVYHHVQCRAGLRVRETLHGSAAKTLPLAFTAQASKQPDGADQLLFLTRPKWRAEASMLALFVLRQDPRRKQWDVLAVLPHDPRQGRGADAERAFLERAADVHAINRRLWRLAAAIDEAGTRRERDGATAAAKVLEAALDEELVLRRAESESPRTMYVVPLERRAREALERLRRPEDDEGKEGKEGKEAGGGGG